VPVVRKISTVRLTMSNSRPMFWRIVRRLLIANRGRLIVILIALGAGAAVTAALLNVQVDAKRRLTTEFRSFGANIVIAPRDASAATNQTLDQSLLQRIPSTIHSQPVSVLPVLYVAADASAAGSQTFAHVIVAGKSGDFRAEVTGHAKDKSTVYVISTSINKPECWIGARVSERLHIKPVSVLTLRDGDRSEDCRVDYVRSTGGPEDDQVTVRLDFAQRLAASPGQLSVIQISAPGTPSAIDSYITDLAHRVPNADVRPIRQFTEAEGKIYNHISGLLNATVVVVLILTTLCVMAAMTNVAMERKNDVGLMKAIGGATRRVLRLFLAEAAILGLIAGVLGAAAGIVLSIGLGKAVFGVAAKPRLIVYPITVTLTVLVAIASAYPLRRLASVRPASVFRGEA
jgi:putative ABC transport system permease protein